MKTPTFARRPRFLAISVPFALLLTLLTGAHAQRTWTGAGIGNDWSTTANWANGEPEGRDLPADDAIIDGAFTVEITQSGEFARILNISDTGNDTVNMTGGDLTARSIRLLARGPGSTATFNFTNGTITLNDNIGPNTSQAVHISGDGTNIDPVGDAVFTMGDIGTTLSNPVLTYQGGRFELSTSQTLVGNQGIQSATFNLESGSVTSTNQNLIIGQRNNNTTSTVNIMGGLVDTGTGDTNMNNGASILNVSGGEYRTDLLQLQNNGGGISDSTVYVSGGLLTVRDINDRNGTSALDISGGIFEIRDGTGNRDVDNLAVSGGRMKVGTFSEPLQVKGIAAITGAPELEFFVTGGAGGSVRWIAGTDTWTFNNPSLWQGGATPDGNIGIGASFTVISAISMTGGTNFVPVDPNWATTQNGNDLDVTALAAFAGDVLTAQIDSPSSIVTRSTDLVLGQIAGVDAAGIDISDGSLDVTNASELILGAAGATGNVLQSGGTVNLFDDLRYLNNGGNYDIRGGVLNVTGEVIEDSPGVNTAGLYVGGGAVNVTGDITVQSFRTGNTGGFPGIYSVPPGQTLTSSGTFFAGNGSVGLFSVDGGTVNGGAVVISGANGGQNSEIEVGSGTFNATGNVDVGRNGSGNGGSFLIASGGTFNANGNNLRFGNNGGDGSLQVDNSQGGGTVVVTGNITTGGGSGTVFINNGGNLVLGGDPATRTVTRIIHDSGGTLTLRIPADVSMTPITGTIATTVNNGAIVEVDDSLGLGTVNDVVSWNLGGSGNWATTANWLADDLVTMILPANGAGIISNGAEFPYLVGPVATNLIPGNVTVNSGWDVVNPGGDSTQLAIMRTGGTTGLGPALARISTGFTVTRSTDLSITPAGGSDAAGLEISGGSTLAITDGGSDPNLTIGGDVIATIDQGIIGVVEGNAVTVDGDIRYGGGGLFGGTYNLNEGTLIVGGSIVEGLTPGASDPAVNTANMHINSEEAGDANALSVTGTIEVQRFSVAEAIGAGTVGNPITHTIDTSTSTSGDMVIGMGVIDSTTGYAHGELIADGTGGDINVDELNVGSQGNSGAVDPVNPNGGSTGVVTLSGSQVLNVTDGRLALGGENTNDYGTSGTLNIADSAAVSVSGLNTEVGRGGSGFLTMTGGTYLQKTNNLVLGQSAPAAIDPLNPSSGHVVFSGGTMTIGDGDNGPNNTSVVFNEGEGFWQQSGSAALNIESNLNLGSGSANPSTFTMEGVSTLTIGQDFSCRGGSGVDTVTLSGNCDVSVARTLTMNPGTNNILNLVGSGVTLDVNGDTLMDGSATVNFTADASGVSPVNVGDGIDNVGAPLREDRLTLNNAALNVDLSSLAGAPPSIVLCDLHPTATRNGASGIFAGLPQDTVLTAASTGASIDYKIDYTFGPDGNDVALVTATDPFGDPDGDFIITLLEDAFDTDPNDKNSGREGLPTVSRADDGSTVTIQFRELDIPGSTTYTVQQSVDAKVWTTAPGTPGDAADQSGSTGDTTLKELTVTVSGVPLLHLRVLVAE